MGGSAAEPAEESEDATCAVWAASVLLQPALLGRPSDGEPPVGGHDFGDGVDRDDNPPSTPSLDDDQLVGKASVGMGLDVFDHTDGLLGVVVDEELVGLRQPPGRRADRLLGLDGWPLLPCVRTRSGVVVGWGGRAHCLRMVGGCLVRSADHPLRVPRGGRPRRWVVACRCSRR